MSDKATEVTNNDEAKDEAFKVTDKLRDKIKSKMDVAKFFTGFITLLIGFLLKDEVSTTPASKVGFILLIASLGFCVAAMFTYDHLLWPKEYLEFRQGKIIIPETDFQEYLWTRMLRLWWALFIPAVGCFGFAFFFLLAQKFNLISLSDYEKGVWKKLVAIAFLLPILFCVLFWPRMGKRNKKAAPISSG